MKWQCNEMVKRKLTINDGMMEHLDRQMSLKELIDPSGHMRSGGAALAGAR